MHVLGKRYQEPHEAVRRTALRRYSADNLRHAINHDEEFGDDGEAVVQPQGLHNVL